MSDRYALNRALNHEAALILVAGGHAPAKFDAGHAPITTGFRMGIHPEVTPENPRLVVMLLHPALLTDEEAARAEESPEAREEVLAGWARRHQAEADDLLPAYAECLTAAGWKAEVAERDARFVWTVPPRAVIDAVCEQPTV